MDIDDFRMFLHLAQHLSFRKTSEAFFLSPSTVTWRVQQMESELSVRLFERDRNRVELSPDGALFYEFAAEVVDRWERLKERFQDPNQPLMGKVRLFCSVTASYGLLPDLLRGFHNDYPQIDVELHTGVVRDGVAWLQEDRADFAIMPVPDTPIEGLLAKQMAVMPLVAVGSRKKGTRLDWENQTFIIPQAGVIRGVIDRWFVSMEIQDPQITELHEFESMLTLASSGYGIAIIPKIVLDQSSLKDRIYGFSPSVCLPCVEIGFFAREDRLPLKRFRALWEFVDS